MRRTVRRLANAALLIAWCQHPGGAAPAAPERAPHDPIAAPTPWIDLGTSPIAARAEPVASVEPPASPDHKLAAALTLGGVYVGFTTWTDFAWYRKHKPLAQFAWGGDGWLGAKTY